MSRFHERRLIDKSHPRLLETLHRFQTYMNSDRHVFRLGVVLKYSSGIDNDYELCYSRLQYWCTGMSYEPSWTIAQSSTKPINSVTRRRWLSLKIRSTRKKKWIFSTWANVYLLCLITKLTIVLVTYHSFLVCPFCYKKILRVNLAFQMALPASSASSRYSIQTAASTSVATDHHCEHRSTCFPHHWPSIHSHWHCSRYHIGTGRIWQVHRSLRFSLPMLIAGARIRSRLHRYQLHQYHCGRHELCRDSTTSELFWCSMYLRERVHIESSVHCLLILPRQAKTMIGRHVPF